MIVHLIIFILISFIFLSFGLISIKAFEYLFKNKIETDYVNVVILGLIVTATLLRFIYLFFPINSFIFILLFICSLLISIFYKNNLVSITKSFFSVFTSSKTYFLFFVVLTIYIGYKSSLLPSLYDVDLYQANLIRWIENFRIIPGLANLHFRIGFMGSWHMLFAFFSFSLAGGVITHALNGWVVWFFMIYCLQGLLDTKKITSLVLAKVFFIVFIFLVDIIRHYLSSPLTDIPIIVFSWIVFLLFLSKKSNINSKKLTDLNLIILPIFLITIKLSAITLPLISLFVLFSKDINIRIKKIGLTISALIIFLQIFSSVILTGYLLYPVSQTGLHFLDWTLPKSFVIEEWEWIKSWAIRPRVDKDIVLQKSIISNASYWYVGLLIFEKKISILLCSLITALIVKVLFSNVFHKRLSFVNPMLILTYVFGLVFWLLSAPSFRFGWGYIVVVLFILLFTLLNLGSLNMKVNNKFKMLFLYLFGLLVIVNELFLFTELGNRKIVWHTNSLVYPMNFRERKTKKIYVNDLLFFVPNHDYETDQTGYWGFPGTPELEEGFYLLGQEYTDGFGIKK